MCLSLLNFRVFPRYFPCPFRSTVLLSCFLQLFNKIKHAALCFMAAFKKSTLSIIKYHFFIRDKSSDMLSMPLFISKTFVFLSAAIFFFPTTLCKTFTDKTMNVTPALSPNRTKRRLLWPFSNAVHHTGTGMRKPIYFLWVLDNFNSISFTYLKAVINSYPNCFS